MAFTKQDFDRVFGSAEFLAGADKLLTMKEVFADPNVAGERPDFMGQEVLNVLTGDVYRATALTGPNPFTLSAGGGGSYVPTGTLMAGFEAVNEWPQNGTTKTVSLDPVNKVEGANALKFSPNAASAGTVAARLFNNGFDPASLNAYAVYVKLPEDIALQSVSSIGVGFRINAGGTAYNGASITGLANLLTDGLWLSGNISQSDSAFRNAGYGAHDIRITAAETDANVAEITMDAFYKDVLANEPVPVNLTFDDAKSTQYSIAYPDLVAAGLTATFYIPTDLVDAGGAGTMSWAQIQEINASGKMKIAPNGTGNDNAISTPSQLVSELNKQNDALAAKGIARATEFCWPFGFFRQVPNSSNRFVRTGIALTAGTDTLALSDTTGIAVGQRAVLVGVSASCRVIAVTANTSVQLSEQMTISASGRTVVFLDDSDALYGNKAIDAAIAAGYKMARSTVNRRAFVGFGFSRRLAMQFPSYGGNGQTASALLALIDTAIVEKVAISLYFHGIASGEFAPSEWASFVSGVKSRQDAGLIKTMSLSAINDRYFNAKPPVAPAPPATPISFVSASATGTGDSVAPTGHQSGDLLLAFAYRDGSTTPPSLPAGWTQIASSGADGNAAVLAWKLSQGASETMGAFTNATNVIVHCYRGAAASPIGNVSPVTTGTSGFVTASSAWSLQKADNTSWVAFFGGTRSNSGSVNEDANRIGHANTTATSDAGGNDTFGPVAQPAPYRLGSSGAAGWFAVAVEIRAT